MYNDSFFNVQYLNNWGYGSQIIGFLTAFSGFPSPFTNVAGRQLPV